MTPPPKQTVFLFPGNSQALRAEGLTQRAAIPCRLIPVPRYLSSECGICLRVQADDRERVAALLEDAGLAVSGIRDLE